MTVMLCWRGEGTCYYSADYQSFEILGCRLAVCYDVFYRTESHLVACPKALLSHIEMICGSLGPLALLSRVPDQEASNHASPVSIIASRSDLGGLFRRFFVVSLIGANCRLVSFF